MVVIVKVFANDVSKSSNRRLFERHISWNEDIQFPYNLIASALKVCFPSSLIQFEIV